MKVREFSLENSCCLCLRSQVGGNESPAAGIGLIGEDSQWTAMKTWTTVTIRRNICVALAALTIGSPAVPGSTGGAASSCRKVAFSGKVSAGQFWQVGIGEGWVFRLLPIQPGQAGYSGWDLVVDRDPPAGYPDALLMATLPYNSINEREIGTTFGLRAQDAIGWNPRSFHFMIDPVAFHEAQQLFLTLARNGNLSSASAENGSHEVDHLLQLEKKTAAGQLHIEDTSLTPGVADAAPFAQAWALAAMHTPHEIVAAADGKPPPQGSLASMRFTVTLWLPESWKLPPELKRKQAPCVR